jgi:hypothetical protein
LEIDVIVYLGVIGSGKSYSTMRDVEKGYLNFNFADEVRSVTWDLLGWKPQDEEQYEYFKKSTISNKITYTKNSEDVGNALIIKSLFYEGNPLTGRELLIKIGDGFRDRFYENIWVDLWKKRVNESGSNKIVISDCRYLNEVFNILNQVNFNSKFIFCDYKSNRYEIIDSKSEWLAQQLLNRYKDQEEIDPNVFYEIYKNFKRS